MAGRGPQMAHIPSAVLTCPRLLARAATGGTQCAGERSGVGWGGWHGRGVPGGGGGDWWLLIFLTSHCPMSSPFPSPLQARKTLFMTPNLPAKFMVPIFHPITL